jgi:hypothetical protein
MVGWYPTNLKFFGKSFHKNNHAFDTMPTPGVVVSYINVTTMHQAHCDVINEHSK